MLRGGAEAGADHAADDQRRARLAAEHVAELRGLVVDLVEADADEVDEHQFGDRPHAGERGAGRRADDSRLSVIGVSMTRSRRIWPSSPLVTPSTPPQASSSPAAAGAADDVLAHHDRRVGSRSISWSSASLIACREC